MSPFFRMEWSKQKKKHIEHEELWYRVSQNVLICREYSLPSIYFHSKLRRHAVKTKSIVILVYLSTDGTTRMILLYSWMGGMAKLGWEGFFIIEILSLFVDKCILWQLVEIYTYFHVESKTKTLYRLSTHTKYLSIHNLIGIYQIIWF